MPLTYWTPRGDTASLDAVEAHAPGAGLEREAAREVPLRRRSGSCVVDSESGMETQTMITLGDTDYTTSPEVLVHEITHQWYGDLVTPTDWKDVWMNEGMTMYLQGQYEADSVRHRHRRRDGHLGGRRAGDARRVRAAGRLRPDARSGRATSTTARR